MIKVCIMEFDHEERVFNFFRETKLQIIPRKGDKLTLDTNGIGYIFEVYDVHLTDVGSGGNDINVVRLGTITEYNASGFPDIAIPVLENRRQQR